MKRALLMIAVLLLLLLAACTSMSKVDGEQVVNERLVVNVPGAWNRLVDRSEQRPYESWTQEGIPLDHLRFWGGVRPGQTLMTKPALFSRAPDAKAPRVPTFRPGLSPEKLVSLFEELYATAGTVTITKMEPAMFDKTTQELVQWVLTSPDGSELTFSLYDVEKDVDIPAAYFYLNINDYNKVDSPD